MPIMDVTNTFREYFDIDMHFIFEMTPCAEIAKWVRDIKMNVSCNIVINHPYFVETIEPKTKKVCLLSESFSIEIDNGSYVELITFEFDTQEEYNLFKLTWG